jgi:hypothetical protein
MALDEGDGLGIGVVCFTIEEFSTLEVVLLVFTVEVTVMVVYNCLSTLLLLLGVSSCEVCEGVEMAASITVEVA